MLPGYNEQRNNDSFLGKFSGWVQCMSTSAWMLMSSLSEKIIASDDKALKVYVDDVEQTVGAPGIAEQTALKLGIKAGEATSTYWLVQAAAITKWLNGMGVTGHAEFKVASWDEFKKKSLEKPVMVGTFQINKALPGGHIMLARGDGKYNDPFGDARTMYANDNGEAVEYSDLMMQNATVDARWPQNNSLVFAGKVFMLEWVA